MFSKLNLLLLFAVTLSALYVTDLRLGIKRQTQIYGKGQEEEIRLKQDRADLLYEHSRHSDARFVTEAAQKMNLREPKAEEVIEP
ncbi:MAG: cell division protein FtsN [Alysiella sp.]|uniref:cell division protein FtsN n=1 Tax=Alysiella sp. TaxID=1872483 RepID=UPI0026DAF26F|nr:cell division protein FtsN [Alysiella sp.]MDO4434562.1 cell division protein FtsN [Alysiella sp.]